PRPARNHRCVKAMIVQVRLSMTRSGFENAVNREGISPRSFSLSGGLPPEQYVLSQDANGWSVYYSEHGRRTGLRVFATERAALDHLFEQLRTDPTAHIAQP